MSFAVAWPRHRGVCAMSPRQAGWLGCLTTELDYLFSVAVTRKPHDLDGAMDGSGVARQSGWEASDNQDGHFGGRGGRMIVGGRR